MDFSIVPTATPADIERHIRVADMCGCGECFCCSVASVALRTDMQGLDPTGHTAIGRSVSNKKPPDYTEGYAMAYTVIWVSADGQGQVECGAHANAWCAEVDLPLALADLLERCADSDERDNILGGTLRIVLDGETVAGGKFSARKIATMYGQ